MSRLSNIIADSVASVEVPGRTIRVHHAVELAVPKILADPELNKTAVREYTTIKVRSCVSTTARKALDAPAGFVMASRQEADGQTITAMVPRQGDLFIDPFGLKAGYSLEGGIGDMKRTEDLTQPEFRGVIRIRVKQHHADGRHIAKLSTTDTRLAEFWDNDPEMTYREACDLYVLKYGLPPKVEDLEDGSED
jgi:hypothetical protein